MNRLLTFIFLLLGISANAAVLPGTGPETTFTQTLKTNVNAADWRTALGVTASGITNANTNQFTIASQVISARDGQALTNANLFGSTYRPFNPSKTYVVFMGDSITWNPVMPAYPYILTNLPQWTNFALWTNQAIPGENWGNQTNRFYTNTIALLPALATNGTNVIISTFFGANESMSAATLNTNAMNLSNFVAWAHTRNYKVATVTPLPRGLWVRNSEAEGAWAQFCDYIAGDTNVDYVIDAATLLGDCYDPRFYLDFDPTNSVLQGLHPNLAGQTLIAREWDRSLRFNSRPTRPGMSPRRFGDNWVFFDTYYNVVNRMNTNGALTTVRGAGGALFTSTPDSRIGGAFMAGNASNPGLTVRAYTNSMSVTVFQVQNSNAVSVFSVGEGGNVTGQGAWSIGSGGTLAVTSAGGAPYISVNHLSGDAWRWRSSSDGSMDWFDSTSNSVRMLMDKPGRLGIGTISPLAYLHVTNAITSMNPFVVTTNGSASIAFGVKSNGAVLFGPSISVLAPVTVPVAYTLLLPTNSAVGRLQNDGAGNLSWTTNAVSSFTNTAVQETWTNNWGAQLVKIRCWGAGGAGGRGNAAEIGSGGGGGGYAEGTYSVAAGDVLKIYVGIGGTNAVSGNGGDGGTSIVTNTTTGVGSGGAGTSLISATGGTGGRPTQPDSIGGTGGVGSAGNTINLNGESGEGSDAASAGDGGAAPMGGFGGRGSSAANVAGQDGFLPGGGGAGSNGGGVTIAGVGAHGQVIIEYLRQR